MKFRKTAAFIMSLAMAGTLSIGYGQSAQNANVSALTEQSADDNGKTHEADYTAELNKEDFWRETMYYDDEEQTYKTWYALSAFKANKHLEEVTIPAEIDNKGIKELSENSVECFNIESLIVPEGVWEIKNYALSDPCCDLRYLTLPDSLKIMSENQDIGRDVAIRGNIGSFAEKFAEKNGYRFEGIGDINGDGTFDSADMLKMAAYMYGIKQLEDEEIFRADCNLDSNINIVDFIMLKNSIIDPKMSSLGASMKDAAAAPDLKNVKRDTSEIDADGYLKFASETAGKVLLEAKDEKDTENTVYSPLSVYMALSMAAECAGSDTRQEIIDVLCADDMDDLRAENSALFNSLYFDDYNAYMKIANSLWLNSKWEFEQDTLDTIAEKYYAVSFTKDFADENTPSEISSWINKNTSGKFDPEIQVVPELEIMKIINTVTFKEKWVNKFSDAKKDIFHLKNGKDIECDFLKKETVYPTENIGFADNYMKYALKMEDNYQMNFILPDEGVSIDEIVGNADTMLDIINDENIEYAKRKIVFSVPKFDVESKFDLIPTAKDIGIKKAFAPGADFSTIINYGKNSIPSAFISEITHEAKVVIDEEGCEAAAYTIISMIAGSAMPPEEEPVYFELNRPFFYYISDNNGTPVFSGIINDPTEK